MDAKLIVVGGRATRPEIGLRLPTIIGRGRQCGLTVAHPMVSRHHCQLFEVDGLLMVKDLGSLNGTVVEGQRIVEAPLLPGEVLTVGPLSFRAEYEYHGDPAAVPPPKLAELPVEQAQSGPDAATALPWAEEPPTFGQLPTPVANGGQRATFVGTAAASDWPARVSDSGWADAGQADSFFGTLPLPGAPPQEVLPTAEGQAEEPEPADSQPPEVDASAAQGSLPASAVPPVLRPRFPRPVVPEEEGTPGPPPKSQRAKFRGQSETGT